MDLKIPSESSDRTVISSAREQNVVQSAAIADRLDINYGFDEISQSFVIASADWGKFRAGLVGESFTASRLADGGSTAASSVWSVRKRRSDVRGTVADLSGTGALWQVYAGTIDCVADAQDFCGPVDAVYTWVDSDDPQWQEQYRSSLASHQGPLEKSSADPARFTSRDELRYSLRSLEMNMPWINKIYLVTAGQRPAWLTDTHAKLTVIDHEQIFDPNLGALPTFNSHAIEARLSFIPDLAEHFIYINDDVFFGRPLHPNSFFGPVGQTKFSMSQQHFADASEEHLPVNVAAANNRNLMVKAYGRTTSRKFKHAAHPQRLSIHRLAHSKFHSELAETAQHKFRDPQDISLPSSLAHQIAACEGQGFHSEIDYTYLDIGSVEFYLQALRLVQRRKPQMFCINEVLQTLDAAERSEVVVEMLQALYPLPSSFEK
ncbi:stealth family protein [Glutamicibacter sp. NPDC087344]|uniref:stealth family protein n=1 Tax=Glutamicibacter sp. NPDC087344 TaxID=3363994 RepID=UPI00380FA9D7